MSGLNGFDSSACVIRRSTLRVLIFLLLLGVPYEYESTSSCNQWLNNYGQDLGEIAVCFLRQDDLYLELPTTGEHGRHHFGSKRVLHRKFLGHWLSRYPNSSSTFKLSRLPISCDVNPNSDPTTKRDCPSCSRTVARNHRALDCNLCRGTFHIKCGKVAPTEFKQMQKSKQKSWSCPTCTERQF